ncbi:C-type lectin 37Db-like [Drosophila nasuta]|uniref:C-type lectin 37Db-like n=1 Tax=Drosophila nasuta TaxID=42062 RepID=UPI00295ED361|nr:C-type lectin 37Db-like [Drosophila nasuta]
MKIVLFSILIAVLAVQKCQANCQELRELESTCGRYCFKSLHPILEHTRVLQSRISYLEAIEDSKTHEKLENIERLLHKTIDPIQALPFERIGSKYYYIEHDDEVNWFKAAHKCAELGGHLAHLQNEHDLEVLSGKLKHKYYWIDINDLANESEYISLTSGLKAPFLKWFSPGEPNDANSNEDCVQLREVDNIYTMNDISCYDKCNFICEKNNP